MLHIYAPALKTVDIAYIIFFNFAYMGLRSSKMKAGTQNQQPSRQRREMKPTPLFNFPTKKFNIPTKISIFPPTSMRTFPVSNIRFSSIATSHLLMHMTQIANHFSHSSTVEVKNGSFWVRVSRSSSEMTHLREKIRDRGRAHHWNLACEVKNLHMLLSSARLDIATTYKLHLMSQYLQHAIGK